MSEFSIWFNKLEASDDNRRELLWKKYQFVPKMVAIAVNRPVVEINSKKYTPKHLIVKWRTPWKGIQIFGEQQMVKVAFCLLLSYRNIEGYFVCLCLSNISNPNWCWKLTIFRSFVLTVGVLSAACHLCFMKIIETYPFDINDNAIGIKRPKWMAHCVFPSFTIEMSIFIWDTNSFHRSTYDIGWGGHGGAKMALFITEYCYYFIAISHLTIRFDEDLSCGWVSYNITNIWCAWLNAIEEVKYIINVITIISSHSWSMWRIYSFILFYFICLLVNSFPAPMALVIILSCKIPL